MTYFVFEDKGNRPYMEDRHVAIKNIHPGYNYYAIFDGHGGHTVAQFLKDNLHMVLKDFLNANNPPEIALVSSFAQVVKMLPKHIAMHQGSTAIVALQYDDYFMIANCGDCRAIIDQDGTAVQITKDHKPHLEVERIKETGGIIIQFPGDVPRVNGHLAVSRSIGDFQLYPSVTWVPEVWQVHVQSFNKYIVMGSDGIWDVLSNQNVVDIIKKNNNMGTCCDIVTRMARHQGSDDNITMICIML